MIKIYQIPSFFMTLNDVRTPLFDVKNLKNGTRYSRDNYNGFIYWM